MVLSHSNSRNSHADVVASLNRLVEIVYRSLPMYLTEAGPWIHSGDEKTVRLFAGIVADARHYSHRIAELILAQRGALDLGDFPMEFTDLNLLSLDFLLTEVLRCQRRDLKAIEACIAAMPSSGEARALADEVLGNARGHLESLEELLARPNPQSLKIAAT